MLPTQRNMTSIYLYKNNQILFLYRQGSKVANNSWIGSAGGHFEENELNDATACILRELKEELDLEIDDLNNLNLRYVTLRRSKEEIRVNYYFFAELVSNHKLASNEGTLQWFELDETKELEMPFTAKYVVNHYIHTGRFDNELYGGIANDKEVIFTKM